MGRLLIALAAMLAVGSTGTAETLLLQRVVEQWLAERDRWSFTQQVREYDGDRLKQERIERYDPSGGARQRWTLIAIDGQPPTPQQREEWDRRKNKKPRRPRADLAERFDFAKARVVEASAESVRYVLPLRSGAEWLFPISKVELIVTISRAGPEPALEQVQARISEPLKVALGLARLLDLDLDVQMEPPAPPDPAEAKPSGTAQAVVSRWGDRIEYFWGEFRRVEPASTPSVPKS